MTKRHETRRQAYRRAGAKLGFYSHFTAYVAVNLLLIVINYSTSPQYLWFKWPLFGWGIGLLFHALAVFAGPPLMRHFVKQELEKDRQSD